MFRTVAFALLGLLGTLLAGELVLRALPVSAAIGGGSILIALFIGVLLGTIAALRQKWIGELPTSGRRAYVVTTADTLVPPERQRAMAASIGADVVEIDTGHSAFGEQPARLAELLIAATR